MFVEYKCLAKHYSLHLSFINSFDLYINFWSRCYYYDHFADKGTELQTLNNLPKLKCENEDLNLGWPSAHWTEWTFCSSDYSSKIWSKTIWMHSLRCCFDISNPSLFLDLLLYTTWLEMMVVCTDGIWPLSDIQSSCLNELDPITFYVKSLLPLSAAESAAVARGISKKAWLNINTSVKSYLR